LSGIIQTFPKGYEGGKKMGGMEEKGDKVLDDSQHAKGLEKSSYYDSKMMDLHLHDLSSLVKKPGNGAK
jgi:hypothetical protein